MTRLSTIRRASTLGLVALVLAGCGDSAPTVGRAVASPSPTISSTPSPTPPPKVILGEYETCVRVQLLIQDSIRLVGDFANAADPSALLKQPYIDNAKALRAAHEVAAPSLAPDIQVVLVAMDAIVKVMRNGGSVSISGTTVANSGVTVTLACLKLGVSPFPSSS